MSSAPIVHSPTPAGLRSSLAMNLRRARRGRGWSLRELALRADVSKALLSKIERGEGNPSIETLYRISAAIGCTMSELIEVEASRLEVVRAGEGRVIPYEAAAIVSRLIFASAPLRRLEIFLCAMEPNTRSEWDGQPQFGVTEYAVVQAGTVLIGPAGRETLLGPGDSIAFRHDTRNVYESFDSPVSVTVVMAYDAEPQQNTPSAEKRSMR
jgi:XRE family transcriptional regulator, regulator of sulfur utilization